MKPQVIGVIPARWQSSRFPGKPLAPILGKSLIRRTYENALRCKHLDALYIATDDERIRAHAEEFGAQVFMTSVSCPTGTERVFEVLGLHTEETEIVVNIQGDEPCIDPLVIDILIDKLRSTPEAVMTTPVAQISSIQAASCPNQVKCVFDKNGRALYFSRAAIPFTRLERQNAYYRHIGIYCFRHSFLKEYVRLEKTPLQESEDLEQLKILESGYPIHTCLVQDQTIGVDTPEDLKILESLLCQKENIYL